MNFDILAATLGAVKIPDYNRLSNHVQIMAEIKQYYENRNREDELLDQFKVTDNWTPSVFSLLLGLQEVMSKKYKVFTLLDFTKAFKDTKKFTSYLQTLQNI